MLFEVIDLYSKTPSFYYISVQLSDTHRNVKFTSEDVYFLNGVAYDFYSLEEFNDSSRAGLKWKTFPLPNEQIPESINPWTPDNLPASQTRLDYAYPSSQSATGLAFVDHIYIITTAKLTDRHANLRRMLERYQIQNYEWRMKWNRENCSSPLLIKRLRKKLNLVGPHRLSTSIRIELPFV